MAASSISQIHRANAGPGEKTPIGCPALGSAIQPSRILLQNRPTLDSLLSLEQAIVGNGDRHDMAMTPDGARGVAAAGWKRLGGRE
jgi:hypothetical protein